MVTSMHFRQRVGSGPSQLVLVGGDGPPGWDYSPLSVYAPLKRTGVAKEVTSHLHGGVLSAPGSLANLGAPRSAVAAAVLAPAEMPRALYVVGGTHNGRSVDTVECFVETNAGWQLSPRPPLPDRRSKAGAVVLRDSLIVVGGRRSSLSLSTVYSFDSTTLRWESLPSMNCAREACGVAELNGRVYAIGGSNGHDALDSVECYDVRSSTWTMLGARLGCGKRSALCAVALGGYVYAIGGWNGSNLCVVERYDPCKRVWTPVASLIQPRSGAAAVVLGGQIYCIGGYSRQKAYETGVSAERYVEASDTWEAVANDSVPYRSYLAAVAV